MISAAVVQLESTMYDVICRDVEEKLARWPGIRIPIRKALEDFPPATPLQIFQPIFD